MHRSLEPGQEQAVVGEDRTIVVDQFAAADRVVTRRCSRWKHDRSVFGERDERLWHNACTRRDGASGAVE